MKKRVKQRALMSEINIVPYVDVMLVLLVIFMITAPLLTQGVKVELPQAAAKEIKSEDNFPLVVTVDSKGRYYLNIARYPDEEISVKQLLLRIKAEKSLNPDRALLVRGDKNTVYENVIDLMVLLQKAGARSVGLVTQTPQGV